MGTDHDEPFNVTVYADDGTVYTVGPNEVSTPSPNYAGQRFFNDTYYPIKSSGNGPAVGPAYLGSLCRTEPAPNVKEGDGSGVSETATATAVPSSTGSDGGPASSDALASTASESLAVPFLTGSGSGSRTGGYVPSGSAYNGSSTPTPIAITSNACSE